MTRLIKSWFFAALVGLALPIALPTAARAGVTPTAPPSTAPTNLTATASDTRVVLAWSPVSGSGYKIFRATAGVWDTAPVATVTSSSFTNYSLVNGTTYSYKVAAYNGKGIGPSSIEAGATPLAAPAGLVAAAGDRQVSLTWQPTAAAQTYTVYRGTSWESSSFVQLAPSLGAPAFVDTGLTNGTTYYYKVRAYAPLGTSALSSSVSAKPLPPPPATAPGNLVAKPGNAKVDLTWDPVDTATGYRIYRTTTGVFDASSIATVAASPYTNWSLTNGTIYSYKVAAYNTGGTGPSSVANAMPIAPPTDVTAMAGDKQVTLNWTPSVGATTYSVFRTSSTDSTVWTVATELTAPPPPGFVDQGLDNGLTGLVNGTTYYYQLRAHATGSTSGLSSRVSARPVPPKPASAPSNLVATSGNGRVDLTWASVDAATDYRIYRATTSTFAEPVTVATATASPYTFWSTNGTTYFFKVAGRNMGGTGPASDPVTAMPIAPPTGVTAKAGDKQVTLNWTPSAGASTYSVLRTSSTDSTVWTVATDLTAPTPPGFVDNGLDNGLTGLVNGTTYYYQLRAHGPESISISGLSSRVSARPVPPPPTDAPGNLVAKEGNARVTLTWDAVANATAYNIFRATTSASTATAAGTVEKPIAKVTTTSFVNTGLTNGTTYSYKVAANNMGGDGPHSGVVTVTPVAPPPAPLDVTAVAGDHLITIAWTPAPGAAAYNIYRGTSAGKQTTPALAAGIAGPPFVDTSAENGPTYYYKVTATNPGGESPRSLEVNATAEGPALVVDAETQAAFRLLRQATWGPRPGDVDHVKAVGAAAFLDEQLGAPPSVYPDILFNLPVETAQEHFMSLALTGPDQLRQRVAWALHKILVVSAVEVNNASAIVTYYRLLMNGAFGNFRTLMREITLNPAMGRYLNNLNNKSQLVTGVPPNENFPRELLQLFTMGIPRLNPNGTPKLVDETGAPLGPAYSEDDVKELARAFTGWTFGDGSASTIPRRAGSTNYRVPMEAVVAYHDVGAKSFLGVPFTAGQSAEQDLDQALDVIFNHPNVGPFIGKQLIQQLVMSNPSLGYVAAVAAVFNDNGAGVRGDLAAVVRAILTHPEASATPPTSGGKLSEPVLFVVSPLRALAATVADHPFMADKAESMGQKVFYPPSVFSYFSPGYRVRGTGPPGGSPIGGPEFQILTSVTALERANFLGALLGGWYGGAVTVDYSPFTAIAKDAAALVDYCNLVFMGGRMSPAERLEIINAVRMSSFTNTTERMRTALYLTLVMAQTQVDR